MSICRFIREYGILGQKVQHVVGSEATNGPKKRLSNFFSRKKKKILKKENLKKRISKKKKYSYCDLNTGFLAC